MNFGQALEQLKNGKKIKRSFWGGYWFISDIDIVYTYEEIGKWQGDDFLSEARTWIIAKLKDGGYAPAQPYQSDLLAEDWEVIE